MKKPTATIKKPEPARYGAYVANCSVENKAAACPPEAVKAIEALALASAEHARAIIAIANALKGAEAHMQNGFLLSGLKS